MKLIVSLLIIAALLGTINSMGVVIAQQRQLIREMATNPYCMGATK